MNDTEPKKPRVVVAMDFSDALMDMLRDAAPDFRIERHYPDVPDSVWADTEVLYTVRNFPDPSQVTHLKWIQLHFAGMDSALKRPIVQSENIIVTSASGIHSVPIAEYCMGMMLAFNLKLPQMIRYQNKNEWPEKPYELFNPVTLRGQTLGIAGYGSIGRELARIAYHMGMKVLASKSDAMHTEEIDAYAEPETGDPTGDIPERIYPAQALASMVKECDYLVIAIPLTADTHHSINAEIFEAMKPESVIINIARGPVIDEKALIEALHDGEIRGAALDVFEEEPLPKNSPLWKMNNVIISPHVAGNNTAYHERAAALFAENLRRYAEKKPLLNKLNRKRGY